MAGSSFGSKFEFMVKYLFKSLSICKECCDLKSMSELLLLMISLVNAGFNSQLAFGEMNLTNFFPMGCFSKCWVAGLYH